MVGAGGGYMFSGRPSVPPCVRAYVRDSRGSFMFPRYLQYLLTDFRQSFVTGGSRDSDELIRFWGQKVKVQGHTIAAEAHSTRRYRRVQLFLVVIYKCASKMRRAGWCSVSLTSRESEITGWAVAQTCCISQWPKYRKRGIFDHPWV